MALEDLSDDEKEDYYIKETDALIVAGKVVCLMFMVGEVIRQSGSLYLRPVDQQPLRSPRGHAHLLPPLHSVAEGKPWLPQRSPAH